jgi:membrane protein YdbS with pleckstrin-like domain
MSNFITEEIYPIETIWFLKPLITSLSSIIILALFWIYMSNAELLLLYSLLFIGSIPFNIALTYLVRRAFHFTLEEQFLTLKQGVISKQERHVPYGVIQHLVIKQDILDRLLGLASLRIENASEGAGKSSFGGSAILGTKEPSSSRYGWIAIGFNGNKINIPGLKKANAETLKQHILTHMEANPINERNAGL